MFSGAVELRIANACCLKHAVGAIRSAFPLLLLGSNRPGSFYLEAFRAPFQVGGLSDIVCRSHSTHARQLLLGQWPRSQEYARFLLFNPKKICKNGRWYGALKEYWAAIGQTVDQQLNP